VLSDPKKKEIYDSGQDLDNQGGGVPSDFGQSNIDPNHIFQMFMGGGRGAGMHFGGMDDDFS